MLANVGANKQVKHIVKQLKWVPNLLSLWSPLEFGEVVVGATATPKWLPQEVEPNTITSSLQGVAWHPHRTHEATLFRVQPLVFQKLVLPCLKA